MNLTVVGLGLLGGSVARAARRRGAAVRVTGVSRNPRTLREAGEAGVIDRGTAELEEGVADAELVVLCAPVGALPSLVRAVWPRLRGGAVLTDVGSVKAGIVAAAEACPSRTGVAFVGGHPMAGSERSGFEASDADLFEGRLTVLTPTTATPAAAVLRVTAFWEALGSQVRVVPVEAHDCWVAAISHLPHLAAYALVAATDRDALTLAARGFADTTRIAASAEPLWTDIFRENRGHLLGAVAAYREVLGRWEGLIRDGRWAALEAELGRAREVREKLG